MAKDWELHLVAQDEDGYIDVLDSEMALLMAVGMPEPKGEATPVRDPCWHEPVKQVSHL